SGLGRRLGPVKPPSRKRRWSPAAAPRSSRRRGPGVAELIALLERTKGRFGAAEATVKRQALGALARRRIRTTRLLRRYHEVLCFLRAYPDDAALLGAVEDALAAFGTRVAALRDPGQLDETGIAGTAVYCPLSYPAARWLATRFPDAVEVDWQDAE